ncbi:eukaryotic initiation factor 4A-III-like isoform X1 [Daktulosphaira vitifoliae]|uniref:eukaryotic initiation factor 4A-III-like isoform X1 n=1 Tax=Daktulosphaira vitifoliae TaxID=58002 RepID=UPI0021A9985A|nr:eukaryotic initiation factor 4A-III-like isoform X1 [Daktulosphaira vitifoliae]XP_050520121.1 eukaryotic initiation factor 4A-III-like isoform X1 [Daktulosphaira vitifoliae]
MDTNKGKQNLEDQIKTLVMEKDLLKKQLNVLNECLSIEELKNKIEDLEMKMKTIALLENMIKQLRQDVEPLNYLKSILKEKNLDKKNSECTSKNKSINETNEVLLKQPELFTLMNSLGESDVLLNQNFNEKSTMIDTLNKIFEEPVDVPDENKSLDGSIHLLDQYDMLSEEDFLNVVPERDSQVGNNSETIKGFELVNDTKHAKLLSNDITNFKSTEPVCSVNNNKNMINFDNCDLPLNEACLANSFLLKQNDEKEQSITKSLASDNNTNYNSTQKEQNSLNTLNLKFDILRGIYSSGYVINPTTTQLKFIEHCVNGKDNILVVKPNLEWQIVILIPMLQRIIPVLRECQVLILVPTRDIALQIEQVMNKIGNFMDLEICIGGDNVPRKLPVVPLVVVGTPAGVSNMIACNSLNTEFISTILMYELDDMMPYYVVIEEIMNKLHVANKQITILASSGIDQILDMYIDSLQDPFIFLNDIKEEPKISHGLPCQYVLGILDEYKFLTICQICEELKKESIIIFCNTLDVAQILCEQMLSLGFLVSTYYSSMNNYECNKKLSLLVDHNIQIFITTDPIKKNEFPEFLPSYIVINYELPTDPLVYISRLKFFKTNTKIINFISENDEIAKNSIEQYCVMLPMPINTKDILK